MVAGVLTRTLDFQPNHEHRQSAGLHLLEGSAWLFIIGVQVHLPGGRCRMGGPAPASTARMVATLNSTQPNPAQTAPGASGWRCEWLAGKLRSTIA